MEVSGGALERGGGWARLAGLYALAALGLLLALQALEPRFFLRDDNASHFLPAYVYTFETVAGFEVPLLNHHQMGGGTFLASGQTGVFLAALYPSAATLRLLGIDAIWLVDVLVGLHLLLVGFGMLLLLRHLGLRPSLALPLALCWAFLPFGVITSRSWGFVSHLVAFLPFNHWLLTRALEAPSARRWAALIVLKAFYCLTGYLHYWILVVVYESLYHVLRWWRAGNSGVAKRQAASVVFVYLAVALLAAPLLVPAWNAKELSHQRTQPLPVEVALAGSLEPAAALAANLFAASDKIYFQLSTAIFFLGPLWLGGIGLRLLRRGADPPFPAGAQAASGAALATGFLALVFCTPLYRLLLALPIFEVLRFPFKGFPIAAFYLLLAVAPALASWAAAGPRASCLAAALGWINLLLQLALLLQPGWRAPISPATIASTVADLRASPLLQPIGDQGRVVLLAAQGDPPEDGRPLALGYLYATLAGKYHVHGYDPLVAKINHEMGYPLRNDGELRLPLGSWRAFQPTLAARYLLLHEYSGLLAEVEASPGVRRLAAAEGFVLLENPAARPIVSRFEGGGDFPLRWNANGLEFDLPADFPGGRLLVNVAGLGGYRYYLDGRPLGAPEIFLLRPVLTLPPGGGKVELRYVDRGFELGLALCAAGLGLLLLLLRRGDAWLDPRGRLKSRASIP